MLLIFRLSVHLISVCIEKFVTISKEIAKFPKKYTTRSVHQEKSHIMGWAD